MSPTMEAAMDQLVAQPPASWKQVMEDLSGQMMGHLDVCVRKMQYHRSTGASDVFVDYDFRRKCAEVVGKWVAVAKLCFQLYAGFEAPPRWVIMTGTARAVVVQAFKAKYNPEKFYIFDAYIGWASPQEQAHGFPKCDAALRNAQCHGRFPSTEFPMEELAPRSGTINRLFRHWRRTMLTQVVPYVNHHTTAEFANFEIILERYSV